MNSSKVAPGWIEAIVLALQKVWLISFPFFSSSSDKTVKVWDAGSRQCVQTFYEHNDQVYTNLGWYIFTKGERGLCVV